MLKTESIASASNPLLKEVRRAVSRGALTATGCAVAESLHLLDEALRSRTPIQAVLAAESAQPALLERGRRLAALRIAVLPDALFATLAATESSQGVMALVEPPQWQLPQLLAATPLVIVLDALQDPGNAGAIVRAAEAFGATGVLFLKGTASPHNPKTLRASAGSLFRVPYLQGMDAAEAIAALRASNIALFAAMPTAAPNSLAAATLAGPCALIIGNEAHGVSAQFRHTASPVSIPTVGVESLNAAVAAGILLYEARRQRMARS